MLNQDFKVNMMNGTVTSDIKNKGLKQEEACDW